MELGDSEPKMKCECREDIVAMGRDTWGSNAQEIRYC